MLSICPNDGLEFIPPFAQEGERAGLRDKVPTQPKEGWMGTLGLSPLHAGVKTWNPDGAIPVSGNGP